MKWLNRSLDQQIRWFYLPVIIIVLVILTLAADLSTFRTAALLAVIGLTGFLHWDLRDGGVLSRWIYSVGGSYNQRNYATVGLAFILVTAILAAADAFYTPLLMLYYIPIVLGALRGGHRMALIFISILGAGLITYFQFSYQVYGIDYAENRLYLLMFLVLSLASGFIADRLRRAAVDLSALYETGRALNSTLNVAEIYPLVLNIVALDLTPDISALFMVDAQNNLRVQAHQGLDNDDIKDMVIENNRGIIGKAAESQMPISISVLGRKWQLPFAPHIQSAVAVPLRAGEKLLGVLMVGKKTQHAYGYENQRFLEALAGQAAISIQNAWLYRQTKEWASLDALTGIYNYRYFSERLDSEWSRSIRYEKPLSLIMIDLDLFKSVNDNYGHLFGDEVLREVALLMKRNTRETDIVARYGGEEFAVILPETHYQDAYMVGQKLRQSVYDADFTGGGTDHTIKLTISLGVANYPSTATTKSDLIYQADQSLYRAKTRRNALAGPLSVDEPAEVGASDIP